MSTAEGAVYRTARQPWRCQCDGSCGELCRDASNRTWCGSPGCTGVILPGDRYVEYLGDTPAYQSGTRYCRPCGIAAWGADHEPPTRRLCAHADTNGEGMHWLEPGEVCDRNGGER